MSGVMVKRSQAILRMPVDMIDAHLIMHDGDRSDVLMFVAPTEDIERVLTEGPAFIAIARGGLEALVARDAIACLGVPPARGPRLDADLPAERQAVAVQFRSGLTLEGELRFVAPPGQQRTTDFLNGDARVIALHAPDVTYVIAKTHIAMVIEK
jgi:hypothetical protein